MAHIIYIIKRAMRDLQDVLLPRICPVCGQSKEGWEDVMCTSCLLNLPRYKINNSQDNEMLRCLWASIPVEYANTWLSYNRKSPYSQLFGGFKYKHRRDWAVKLSDMACQELGDELKTWGIDAVVPVPIHWRREWERNYNQTEALAERISQYLNVPIIRLIKRVKYGKHQARMNAKEREMNAKDIYEASVPTKWHGKHILIVDDVMTTGSTLVNCAKTIQKSDESVRISVFTLSFSA